MKKLCSLLLYVLPLVALSQSKPEQFRPLMHFSPKAHWINDPNGMVYHNGVYHLFFQYHPFSNVWGPMHWGHAVSKDLIHWDEKDIALYPDSLGMIFSGSAVLDINNTSGFGINGKAPLVAIYTNHDEAGSKAGKNNYQTQSIAYSNDEGVTWIKYNGNPVVKNPGIVDFRDPKVSWYEPAKKWIMTLATKDRITFYSSSNLKDWNKESEFGKDAGAHGGVWECPDLFTLDHNGKKVWVLVVNINPGGPNKGSASQYFLGDFDGHQFTASHTDTRWVDYGPDEYAGITWSNTGDRKIFLGWMNNWLYANKVPTKTWNGAMTLPRDLKLKEVGKDLFISSTVVPELSAIESKPVTLNNINVAGNLDVTSKIGGLSFPAKLELTSATATDLSLIFSNDAGEQLIIGYDKNANQYFVDRTKSGVVDFHNEFASKSTAPKIADSKDMHLTLLMDASSIELFADDGLTVMTAVFFPTKPYTTFQLQSLDKTTIQTFSYTKIKSALK